MMVVVVVVVVVMTKYDHFISEHLYTVLKITPCFKQWTYF